MLAEKIICWKLAPFLRLLLPLITGILIEYFLPVGIRFQIQMFCLALTLFIFCHFISFSSFSRSAWVAGLTIQIMFFSFGRILMSIRKDIQVEQSFYYKKNQKNVLLLRNLSDPVSKQHSLKCIACIRWLVRDHSCFHENEKIFVYFKNVDAPRISEGSLIILKRELQPITNPKNSDFNYIKYCHLRHIYGQIFLKEGDYAFIHYENEKSIFSRLDALRQKILIIIKNQLPSKSESSLLEAMLVGFRDDLDPVLLKSYTDTGVIHIIIISGLHLALICYLLQFVLNKTSRKKTTQWLKVILVISTIWGYTFLCGASPAILRSALMFSIALIARNIFREAVLYNTLAASAFLLLCFDPYWIWDTGFQLSYAAVWSLGLFAKPVRFLLPIQNKLLAVAWNGASVSIGVQILTAPLSIFYFHRFPTYFLISNLVAVPLSSVILAGGILLCCCYWFQPLGRLLGWILSLLIQALNVFIAHISKMPGAIIPQLSLTLLQLILIYIIIFCFYRFGKIKEKLWLIAALASISIFQITRFIH